MARGLTLDLPQWRVLRRIRLGVTCLQPHQKVLGKGTQKSRPQKVPSLHSGLPVSPWKVERGPDFTILSSFLALKSGVSFLFLENHRGFIFLTKQKRKHLQKTLSWKELWFCLLKTSRAQDISDSRVCICLEVQGVSEVFLNTDRILGQHPVRKDGSQTQIVGNRLKKKKQQQMST